jgi:hypothetical protein
LVKNESKPFGGYARWTAHALFHSSVALEEEVAVSSETEPYARQSKAPAVLGRRPIVLFRLPFDDYKRDVICGLGS